jgi:hypothetical protein
MYYRSLGFDRVLHTIAAAAALLSFTHTKDNVSCSINIYNKTTSNKIKQRRLGLLSYIVQSRFVLSPSHLTPPLGRPPPARAPQAPLVPALLSGGPPQESHLRKCVGGDGVNELVWYQSDQSAHLTHP